MKSNPLVQLRALGQSVWLDYIHRDLFASGRLRKMIEDDALSGMTSNPAIFQKAMGAGAAYDEEISSLAGEGRKADAIYEQLSQHDVQHAADEFRAVYDASGGEDGFVSLEVNPHLAQDTQGTITEARRLWKALDRPNVMIKVPGTHAGLPAICTLISEGININVTLLFGIERYREVMEAYLAGLERRASQNLPLRSIASVASFFVSRIDALIDPMLDKIIASKSQQVDQAKAARGRVAIANARLAYQLHTEIFSQPRFQKLQAKGAQVQRPLWASTSTKDPLYSDVKYVEALIGANTVDTIPVETLDAYRDHGEPQLRLGQDMDEARWVIDALPKLGIDLPAATAKLEQEGVDKFVEPFDKMIATVQTKAAALAAAPKPAQQAGRV